MTIQEWLQTLINNEIELSNLPDNSISNRSFFEGGKLSYQEVLKVLEQYKPEILKMEINF